MTAPLRHAPGARPVGALAALPPLPALAVRALRLWCEGGEAAVADDLAPWLGADAAGAARAFAGFAGLALAGAHRPLLRHGADCPCLCADEVILAEVLRGATEGEREEALGLACALVRADLAPALLAHAQAAGLQLVRALLRPRRGARLH